MYKKLGWIAFTGFSVGFASLVAAYAAGGGALFSVDNLRRFNIHLSDERVTRTQPLST
jgi:hypothetical protein